MASSDDVSEVLDEENPGPMELESLPLTESLQNILSNHGLALDEETPLAEAVRLMRERNQGCVLVTSQGKLLGIFTERDVLMKVVGVALDLERTSLHRYMTHNPVTLPADASVAYALNRMVGEGFRNVPLVDDQGRPVGVVSMRDIIEYLSGFFPKDVLNLPPNPTRTFREREGA